MDALQQTGVRLREHITRCQICHWRIKLRRSISPPLRAMAGQTILLVERLASNQISFIGGKAGCECHKPTGCRQHAQDREAGALHGVNHPINDGILENAVRIAEATSRFDRVTQQLLDWQQPHHHRRFRSVQVQWLQSAASPQSWIA